MKPSLFIASIISIFLTTIIVAQVGAGKGRPAKRPNVLFISVDDLNDW